MQASCLETFAEEASADDAFVRLDDSGVIAVVPESSGEVTEEACAVRCAHRECTAERIVWLRRAAPSRAGAPEHAERAEHHEIQAQETQRLATVGRLASAVAHDVNNLLAVVSTCAQAALSAVLPGESIQADLEDIRAATDRAASLTKQLLRLGRGRPHAARTDEPAGLLQEIASLLRRVIGKQIELELDARATRPVAIAPGQLEQIVTNLALNARDAIPKGGRIRIATEDVELDPFRAGRHGVAPGRYLRLLVADTGTGMDEATRARIFDAYFSTKGPDRGTGLGLATVLGIVRSSRGAVEVDSAIGRGTTFRVYLPALARPGSRAVMPPASRRDSTRK